ncbi:transmembrane protein [Fagus crenata]
MEDNHVAFEDHEATTTTTNTCSNNDHGWQKVTYAKRQRKTAKPSAAAANLNKSVANAILTGADNVFLSLGQDSADCRRRILEAQRSAVDFDVVSRSKHRINDDDDSSDGEGDRVAENGKAEESKKVRRRSRRNRRLLSPMRLLRSTPTISRLFSPILRLRTRGSRRVQFPWVKMFREFTVAKFADVSNALELSLNCYVCG